MVAQVTTINYPDSDGKPMSDNTKQFRWIQIIEQNLEWLYADDSQVFIAGDLLWYPVEGRPQIVTAPDVLVVFGRPKGDRGSYKQWEEDNIAPQVVFEILSPSNSKVEMDKKLLFYDRYGVMEYYIYDPDRNQLEGWIRGDNGTLENIGEMNNWNSPRLGIRFEESEEELKLYRPDGTPFHSYSEVNNLLLEERQRAEVERQRAEAEKQRAEEMEALLVKYRAQFGDLNP
ncbi:MAG: Uma2 family endonuclease [Snowella sp.]|nr:Uma2 family endonuclease [Snowella sp.]